MRIKSFKIKIDKDNVEQSIPSFYGVNNTIYSINSELVFENGTYYWFVLITYESKINFLSSLNEESKNNKKKFLPVGFKEAVCEYSKNQVSNTVRVKNCVNFYAEELLKIKNIDDFKRIRGLGVETIKKDESFLLGLIEIIKRFQDV
jgi:hypothetical protein